MGRHPVAVETPGGTGSVNIPDPSSICVVWHTSELSIIIYVFLVETFTRIRLVYCCNMFFSLLIRSVIKMV
jgi:hypothetical protein